MPAPAQACLLVTPTSPTGNTRASARFTDIKLPRREYGQWQSRERRLAIVGIRSTSSSFRADGLRHDRTLRLLARKLGKGDLGLAVLQTQTGFHLGACSSYLLRATNAARATRHPQNLPQNSLLILVYSGRLSAPYDGTVGVMLLGQEHPSTTVDAHKFGLIRQESGRDPV